MKIDAKKVMSILLIMLFLISVSLFIIPVIYKQLVFSARSLKDIEIIDIDTGEKYTLNRVKSQRMLFFVYEGLAGPELDKLAGLISELGLYAESNGYRVVVVVSGGKLNSFRDYISNKYPILLNKYTWVYDPEGVVSNMMGHGSNRGRVYIVYSDWSFKFIGDTSTPINILMGRLR